VGGAHLALKPCMDIMKLIGINEQATMQVVLMPVMLLTVKYSNMVGNLNVTLKTGLKAHGI